MRNKKISVFNPVQICCYRFMHNLCGKFKTCESCNPEVKATIERELSELKKNGGG
ncbi:MAG: hypothetical protein ACFE9S_15610 [Candidatus Hermodarchaeota archaeon]